MATIRQKTAIKKTYENLLKQQPIKMGEIMLQSGYKPSVAKHPDILTKSKAWEIAMRDIEWGKQLQQVEKLADIEINQDKDNALKAKDMLFKLGDKYPAQKSKVIGLIESIDRFNKDNKQENGQNKS